MSDPTPRPDLARFTVAGWRRLQTVLDQVMDAPAEETAALLDRLCRGDPDLRALAEQILRTDAEAEGVRTGALFPNPAEVMGRISEPAVAAR